MAKVVYSAGLMVSVLLKGDFANTAAPDQAQRVAASDQGLYFLH